MHGALLSFRRERRRRFLAGALGLLAILAAPVLAVTVTVRQAMPLESLSPAGDVTAVSESRVGDTYTLVSCANGQLILRDAPGQLYRLALAATDYTPPPAPAAAPSPSPSRAASPVTLPAASRVSTAATPAARATPAVRTTPAAAPAPFPAVNPAEYSSSITPPSPSDITFSNVNAAMGKPFFSDQPLWGETALMVAQRLGLGLEGRTLWEASYRRYFSGQRNDAKSVILGNGAYCVVVYADAQDHPTSVLIAFANDGDFHGIGATATELEGMMHAIYSAPNGGDPDLKQQYTSKFLEMETTFEPLRQSEQQNLTDRLTALFGQPQQTSFGSDADTKENALRWDWNGASFLLTCVPQKYDLLRIVPTELADNNGHTPRISRDDIGHRLSGAVEHRDNGDVIITQLPMADQGQKGYCVPATWERVLRYTGVPGDMYTLSRIGDAGFGGGEDGLKVADELNKTLYYYGRHVEVLHPTHLDYIALRHYIDDGIPIFWAVNPRGYDAAAQRYSLCDRDKDFDTWKKLLDQARANPETGALPPDQGHQVLIIGYNPETKEIAWTDPWGRETKERWMTQEEAQRCTLGEYYIISW